MNQASPWSRLARPRDRADESDPFRRLGARIVDLLVLAPAFLVLIPLGRRHDHETAAAVAIVLIGSLYEIVCVGTCGRSIGKLATHIRVVAADGGRVTWGQAVVRDVALRELALVASFAVGPLVILWPVIVAAMVVLHGLGPHDYAARTKVVGVFHSQMGIQPWETAAVAEALRRQERQPEQGPRP